MSIFGGGGGGGSSALETLLVAGLLTLFLRDMDMDHHHYGHYGHYGHVYKRSVPLPYTTRR